MVPRATMEKELKDQEKGLSDDIHNLNKKVSRTGMHFLHDNPAHQTKYLEKQFSDAQSQIRDIVSAH
jgi:prefoldin subunit 1